ncbi:MerR family transcriptional regulator [Propionibacteriaceae bacterium Y1923]
MKQVVAMTGITAARLRAWERRYGVVTPQRTDAKYRRYDETDVQRLRTMVQLVDSGVGPAEAASIVLSQDQPRDQRGHDNIPPPGDLADAAGALDVTRMARILARALVLDDFEAACDGWLTEAVTELDVRRKRGELLDVHVRAAEQAIVLRLVVMFHQASATAPTWQGSRPSVAPMVLLGQQEHDGRDLVPMLFSVALRRHGVDSRYLGRAISTEGWQQAVRQLRPRAVAISSSSARGRRESREVSATLGASSPPVQVWLGGPGHDPSEAWVLPLHMRAATHAMLGQLRGGTLPRSAPSAPSVSPDE